MEKNFSVLLIILSIVGIADASYLTYEHYYATIPPCSTQLFSDCGKVLTSSYATIFSIPLALIGVIHYLNIGTLSSILLYKKNQSTKVALFIFTFIGLISSLYFVYLQVFVLQAICFYCMISAINSLLLFFISYYLLKKEPQKISILLLINLYTTIIKPILFKINPEIIHVVMVRFGEILGSFPFIKSIFAYFLRIEHKSLVQKLAGIEFKNPIGLSAGFDYEARLTQILPAIGFGFGTIGTITNSPYQGNPRPMLGRLPESKSLMVNKGFKNDGADTTIKKLEKLNFEIPIGISIGRTNSKLLNHNKSILDILKAFHKFENANLNHSYYELNISCPNLFGNVNFYQITKLNQLLNAVDRIKLTKPIFIKMPIDKTNREILEMLKVISKHNITGVIFGNLQKDRNHPSLDQTEVAKFPVGNFSGKPTFDRSNELIALTFRYYKDRLIIIGSGGVFSAEDAYLKIKLGASLVQLITGMIFQGPQLVAEINLKLPELLNKDRFRNISEAIGSNNK